MTFDRSRNEAPCMEVRIDLLQRGLRRPGTGSRRCRVKKTVWGLIGLLFLGISASIGLCQDLELPFEISTSQSGILVRGTANGKPVLLILDTGASRTILSRDLLRSLPRPVLPSRFSTDGPGLNTRGIYTEATLELGGRLWRGRSVVAMEMEEVSRAFGQRIDGLL